MAEANFNEEFSKKLEEIVTGVQSTTKMINEVKEENKDIKAKLESKKEDSDDNDEFFDEDSKVKKLEKELEEVKRNQEQGKFLNQYEKDCSIWDSKAYAKFEQLNDPHSEFFKEVQKELNNFPVIGKHPETKKAMLPPSSVYDAAARVFASDPERFKPKPKMEDLDGGGFRKQVKGQEITDIQKELAARLNVQISDKLKERAKVYNLNRSQRRR